MVVEVKKICRQKTIISLENYYLTPKDLFTMKHPKLVVSNRKEESIIIFKALA